MLLSELRFDSLLAYSPRGGMSVQAESRQWTWKLKDETGVGNPRRPASTYFAERLAVHVRGGALPGCFGSDVILVPVPGHAPLTPTGMWVPARLCARMVAEGLAAGWESWLERVTAVEKSRTIIRPSAQEHASSMRVVGTAVPPRRIVLVDDVITRGAVGLASASLLASRFPDCPITLFAMIRTISNPDEFQSLLAPCSGTIQLQHDGSTIRVP